VSHPRARARRLLLPALIAALLINVQTAEAFTVSSITGVIGRYGLTDSPAPIGQQAAICFYNTTTFKLAKIEVRGPQVKARNRTSSRDSQWVGWQFIVQQQAPSGTTWATIHSSTVLKALAYDNLAASFADGSWTGPSDPSGKYRLVVVIRWYSPGSSTAIQGQAKVIDSYYESTWNGASYVNESFCLQDY
jgi:hypothetical protein